MFRVARVGREQILRGKLLRALQIVDAPLTADSPQDSPQA